MALRIAHMWSVIRQVSIRAQLGAERVKRAMSEIADKKRETIWREKLDLPLPLILILISIYRRFVNEVSTFSLISSSTLTLTSQSVKFVNQMN
jgi:hypothetical protein